MEFANSALHEAGAHLGNGEWDGDLRNIEAMYLEDGEFLVGEMDGEIVAMGALKKIVADTAEMKRMRVAPKWQRRGLGQRMLSFLEERAMEMGYSRLRLDTAVGQIAARRMYEKNGCREAGRGRAGRFECVFMEKCVGRSRG